MLRCQNCNCEIDEDEVMTHEGKTLCQDCYIEATQRIRACDPWGEHSKRVFRETHGLTGTEGLTELQAKIYNIIYGRGKATGAEICKELGITPKELENQFALLRHCQLVKGRREGDIIYMVPW